MVPVAITMNGEVSVYEISKEDKKLLDGATQIWEMHKIKKAIKEKYTPLVKTEGFYK